MRMCPCSGARCRLSADDNRHGTRNGYCNLWCRCQDCRDANADAHFAYMESHPEQREIAMLRERRHRGDEGTDPNRYPTRKPRARRRIG